MLVAETETDGAGQFAFQSIAPGDYRISAAAPGLTAVAKDVVLLADQMAAADLQFGAVQPQSQSVVITAKALEPAIDLRNSEVPIRLSSDRDDQVLQQLNAGQHE